MSWQGLAALLLVLAAVGVAALAAGALLYGSLLPREDGLPEGGTTALVTTGALFIALVVAAVWVLRSRRARRSESLDRSLMELMLGEQPRDEGADGER